MRHTIIQKQAGELAIRDLSAKAKRGYAGTDPLEVFEYSNGNETLYAVKDADGAMEGLTKEVLEQYLESWDVEDEDDD